MGIMNWKSKSPKTKLLKDVNPGDIVNGKKVVFNEFISRGLNTTKNKLTFDDETTFEAYSTTKVLID